MRDETVGKLGLYVGIPQIDPPAQAVEPHPLQDPEFAWPDFVYVRRDGTDTGTCAAAVCPYGYIELLRFIGGARKRGETALGIREVGATPGSPEGFALPDTPGSVVAEHLPEGVFPQLAEGLSPEDRDFALRLRQNEGIRWSALSLQAGDPGALFRPLLVDALGKALAGVWIPTGLREQRWYLIPRGCRWEAIIDWLVNVAIKAYVPQAANRVHELAAIQEWFLTEEERQANSALQGFEEEVERQRGDLVTAAEEARTRASGIRTALLHRSGDELKDAVAKVLRSCGFEVEDLDETFGEPLSGDLLVSLEGKHWLIESKAASGAPAEDEISSVVKHLRTWTQLGRAERLEHAILVWNHHYKRPPAGRPRAPYSRKEFVASLPDFGVSVVSAMALCKWWAAKDCQILIAAVTSSPGQYAG